MPNDIAPPLYIDPSPDFLDRCPALLSMAHELAVAFTCGQIANDRPLQGFGLALWHALEMDVRFRAAFETAENRALPLIIQSDQTAIQNLPWECLFHPKYGFLARDSRFLVSRTRTSSSQTRTSTPKGPLRVLLFSAQPQDLSELQNPPDVDVEQEAILEALNPFIQQGKASFTRPHDGRFDVFRELIQDHYHLVFLSGHGHFHTDLQGNPLTRFYFESRNRNVHAVDARSLANALAGQKTQCLVVSACNTGKRTSRDLAGGMAHALWNAGVPNVVTMQEPVLEEAATRFETEFCRNLVQGQRLDAAVQAGRRVMASPLKSPNPRYNPNHHLQTLGQWSLPAVYSAQADQPLINPGSD